MGKRKGRQQDSELAAMQPEDFAALYAQRAKLPTDLRRRVERHAKAIGLRNRARRRSR